MIYRKFFLVCTLITVFLTVYLPISAVTTHSVDKKLIIYDQDTPSPNFLLKHVKEIDKSPFDGIVLKLSAGKEVFKKNPYPDTAFTQDRKEIKAIKYSELTDNFIIMWSGIENGWDWFNDSDWAASEKNIKNFAKTVKIGHFRGIAFDSEPYAGNTWEYNKQSNKNSKTFEEYQKQVRKRGAQFIRILQKEQPDTQILTLGLLSWMKHLWMSPINSSELQNKLTNHVYGLWPSFINGMLDAAQPGSLIIDGNEWAYYYSRISHFEGTRKMIFKDALLLVDQINRRKYKEHVRMGQSVFLDLVLDVFSNDIKNPLYAKTMPHFLSQDDRLRLLEHNIYQSLRTTDRYTWVYNERGNWRKGFISKGVDMAIRKAKAKIKKRQPLGFNIDSITKKALKTCQSVTKECQLANILE
jgi:hypothetical protein